MACKQHSKWFFYVVRCADNSLYAGITKDLKRRVNEHNTSSRGAKYTRSRRPVSLCYHRPCANKSEAIINENSFKKLPKSRKEKLILGNAYPEIFGEDQ